MRRSAANRWSDYFQGYRPRPPTFAVRRTRLGTYTTPIANSNGAKLGNEPQKEKGTHDHWIGHKFTLLKTDGGWKIISKVFYLHPES